MLSSYWLDVFSIYWLIDEAGGSLLWLQHLTRFPVTVPLSIYLYLSAAGGHSQQRCTCCCCYCSLCTPSQACTPRWPWRTPSTSWPTCQTSTAIYHTHGSGPLLSQCWQQVRVTVEYWSACTASAWKFGVETKPLVSNPDFTFWLRSFF